MAKIRRVRPGDLLGFVGPAGAVSDPGLVSQAALAAREMGYRAKIGPSCAAQYGYLSGGDALRAQDLNRMFGDDAVRAVVCARGGYGVPRILDKLDYAAIAAARKPLLGYSDITGLHLAVFGKCGLPTLHGPMPTTEWVARGFEGFNRDSLLRLLNDEQAGKPLKSPPGAPAPEALRGGACEGVLVGGNLSLVCALMGTPYMPDLRDKILLLEDVDEYPYRVDRMLTQLRLAGAFAACAGVALGAFTRCRPEEGKPSLSLEQVFWDCVADGARGPVVSGFQIGHCAQTISLALGIRYRLDGAAGALTPLESPYAD